MHRLIYIDYAYVFMYSITKTLYIMQLRLKKRLTFYVYRRKIAVKSLFIMLFFKEKKPLDFIQNWVLLLYGSSYQNIYSIAYIFRITHPVRFFEKLIRWWWALFGWLHVNYPISISPASDFLWRQLQVSGHFFCKQAYFLWNVIFLVATFCFRQPSALCDKMIR